MGLRGPMGSSTPTPARRMKGIKEVEQTALEAKRLRCSDRPTTKPIKMKREKKEEMERELQYSSFSVEKEECASGALFLFFLFFLFINITQHISVTLIHK